ncbi:unnamed protein product [Phytophthora fragariaefolia]|uniref:Unnamed protein product n=1 Tax=Phytophthora fragariaefolia TaxID=1490495 RepID=A0A9W6TVG4_9STRA|nr:unnamed protein product [Phytophthora fragariaefolia]
MSFGEEEERNKKKTRRKRLKDPKCGGRLSSISERSVSFDEWAGGIPEAKDEEVNEYEDSKADGCDFGDDLGASDEARVSAGRSGAPRPITRNLAGEFDEVAKPEPARDDSGSDNEVSGKKPADESVIRKLPGNRPSMNSNTPAANGVIGRILNQMMESSDWIRQFTPKAVRQARWTVSLLRAMGLEPQTYPSEAALRDWPPAIAGKELKRWKRKLPLSFGTSDIGLKTPPTVRPKGDADPSQIPLHQTPKKNEQGKENDDDGVFGVRTEGTPYFQDSHMVTPRPSNRTDRLARDTEASSAQRGNARASSGRSRLRFVPRDGSSDDDSDDGDYFRKEDAEYDDPSGELARQVREPSLQRRFKLGSPPTETGLVPIGLPQLASPPVDVARVYAFVGESKWQKTQRREEVNELNTMEIEKERNGSFDGRESDERRYDEWKGGSSEGLVSSVTQKTWHDYHPENVIKLLSGERFGWWILLDTGANVSVISEPVPKQLRMHEVRDHGRCMEIQGFTKGTMATTKRALVKVNLGWNQVYEYELLVMDHGAGVDVGLGTDFMIPAGVRLDLFHAIVRLPDEVEIPLIKTQRMADTRGKGPHVPDGSTGVLTIPGHESRDYRPMRQPPTNETHELWVRRTKELILKFVQFRRGRPRRILVTNTSDRIVTCPVHLPLLLCVPRGDLPRTEGYVRQGSDKYNEWRDLAYSRSRDSDLFKDEGEIYQRWLAAQPSVVERVSYTTPTKILRRPSESSDSSEPDGDDQAECAIATTEPSTETEAEVAHQEGTHPKSAAHSDRVSESSKFTQLKLEGAYIAAATVSEDWGDHDASNVSEHPEQQDRVVKVLKSHERIMISSGNALPLPAYGVVCDIDVQGHPPIKKKAHRIPLRHLKQLHELLKGLLKAGLIAFSDSPWASPIVIVLKKNGVDIRLCIEYKMVNSVTPTMEYAMPLVDGLLTDMEGYLWYCSLDAASGFWAVMMTQRARKISVFLHWGVLSGFE